VHQRGSQRVRLLHLGKARGQRWNNTPQHFGFQHVLDDLPGDGWKIVGGLPGGTRQPFMTWGRYAQAFLVVVDPTPASMLTGRRLARLVAMPQAPRVVVVANKVRERGDIDRVREGTGLSVIAVTSTCSDSVAPRLTEWSEVASKSLRPPLRKHGS